MHVGIHVVQTGCVCVIPKNSSHTEHSHLNDCFRCKSFLRDSWSCSSFLFPPQSKSSDHHDRMCSISCVRWFWSYLVSFLSQHLQAFKVQIGNTITQKKITKLIPKQFRFGNSSVQITEYNSNNNSVRDSVILCSHCLPRPSDSRNNSVRQSQSRNYRK